MGAADCVLNDAPWLLRARPIFARKVRASVGPSVPPADAMALEEAAALLRGSAMRQAAPCALRDVDDFDLSGPLRARGGSSLRAWEACVDFV